MKSDEIDQDALSKAVVATASRRGSLEKMGDCESVLEEVKGSAMMQGFWSSYVSASPYAAGLDFKEAVDSAIRLAKLSGLEGLR